MGGVPREFVRDLAARADLAAIIGARVSLRRRGRNLVGLCPFHSEKTPSFSVSPEKGLFYCFGCGAHGDAVGFLMQKDGLDFLGAIEALARECGVEVPREESPRERATAPLAAALAAATAHFCGELAKSESARAYLRGRGVGEETADAFRLGFAPPEWDALTKKLGAAHSPKTLVAAGLARAKEDRIYDYFRGRLMFPILSPRRDPIGFGGRALGEDAAKYLNSPETALFRKGDVLFGLPQATEEVRRARRVVAVEGYMDVVGLFESGVRNAAATMGTAATERQAAMLIRMADDVVFAFDGDDAGVRAARRALENCLPALRDGKSVSFALLPRGEDPDSVARSRGAAGFERILRGAKSLGDFLADSLRREFESLPTVEARKSAFLRRGGEMLQKARAAPYLRQTLLAQLAERVSIPAAGFADAIRAAGPEKTAAQTAAAAAAMTDARANMRMRIPPRSKFFRILLFLWHRPDLLDRVIDARLPMERDSPRAAAAAAFLASRMARADSPDLAAVLREHRFDMLAADLAAATPPPNAEVELESLLAAVAARRPESLAARKAGFAESIEKGLTGAL